MRQLGWISRVVATSLSLGTSPMAIVASGRCRAKRDRRRMADLHARVPACPGIGRGPLFGP